MKDALVRLLESTKFWTLMIGLTATFLAKYGVHVDDSTAQMIASGFALLLGAQALTDHGKAAALVHARVANENRAANAAHLKMALAEQAKQDAAEAAEAPKAVAS